MLPRLNAAFAAATARLTSSAFASLTCHRHQWQIRYMYGISIFHVVTKQICKTQKRPYHSVDIIHTGESVNNSTLLTAMSYLKKVNSKVLAESDIFSFSIKSAIQRFYRFYKLLLFVACPLWPVTGAPYTDTSPYFVTSSVVAFSCLRMINSISASAKWRPMKTSRFILNQFIVLHSYI